MSVSPYSGAALKRSAMYFLVGKAASALLTFGLLIWLVRLLAVAEYGVYVTLQAGMAVALSVTAFGLPWVAARYLPDFRLHASGKQLARFVWQVIFFICLVAVVGALLLFVAMPWLLDALNLEQQTDIARFYLLVLVLEGLRQNIQECILEPLLQQGQAQFSQVVRNLTLLLCLGIVSVQGTVHLHHVVLAELMGSFLGTALALRGLFRYLRSHLDLQGKNSWQPPRWPEMWGTARHMYFSHLIAMTYSAPTFVFLTQRFLGVEATALFGFLLKLYGQIRGYLPAALLFGLVRPKLITSYVGEGGMAQLARNANLVGKVSLFVLMPLLVFAWVAGEEVLNQLSGGKFIHSGYYLGGMLLGLIPLSQRQILETVAVASSHSYLCSWGSFLGVLTLPLAYWFVQLGLGLWSFILAMILGQMIFNLTLIAALTLTTTYRPDAIGLFKLVAASLMGFVLCILTKMAWTGDLFQLQANGFVGLLDTINGIIFRFLFLAHNVEVSIQGWQNLSIMAALACGLYLLAIYFFNPFHKEERMRLIQLFNNKLRS